MAVKEKEKEGILQKIQKAGEYFDYLPKDKENRFHKYKYVSESLIKEKAHQMLQDLGIVFNFSIEKVDMAVLNEQILYTITAEYSFIDTDTGERFGGKAAGSGIDSGDKGLYKAITGAIKYIFHSTFLIPSGDDPERDDKEEIKTEKFIPQEAKKVEAKTEVKAETKTEVKPKSGATHEEVIEKELGGKVLVDPSEDEAQLQKYMKIIAGSDIEPIAKDLAASKTLNELKQKWMTLSPSQKKRLETLKELLKKML